MSEFVIRASADEPPEGIGLFIPPLNEIVWSAIFFAALFLLFWKFVLPAVKKSLAERTEGIEDKLEQAERERVEAVLDEGISVLKQQGIEAQGHLRAGEPSHQIAKLAQDLGTDLVVVGHQRRGVLARWWQGSVGASLLDRLDCSLLVAQQASDSSDEEE